MKKLLFIILTLFISCSEEEPEGVFNERYSLYLSYNTRFLSSDFDININASLEQFNKAVFPLNQSTKFKIRLTNSELNNQFFYNGNPIDLNTWYSVTNTNFDLSFIPSSAFLNENNSVGLTVYIQHDEKNVCEKTIFLSSKTNENNFEKLSRYSFSNNYGTPPLKTFLRTKLDFYFKKIDNQYPNLIIKKLNDNSIVYNGSYIECFELKENVVDPSFYEIQANYLTSSVVLSKLYYDCSHNQISGDDYPLCWTYPIN